MGPIHWDRQGNPLDTLAWAELYENHNYRQVALTTVTTPAGQEVKVSTVWMGLDQGFGATRQPLIFETAVFLPGVGDYYDGVWRCATEQQAREGHRRIVQALQRGDDLS